MKTEKANFSKKELALVLKQYDIGRIEGLKYLRLGTAQAPKVVIASSNGKYILKRRQKGKDDSYHVAYAHDIHLHLEQHGFAVPRLIATKEDETIVNVDGKVYELFEFVQGGRYDGSIESTIDAGRNLALFHKYLSDFECPIDPRKLTYHDSSAVRRHLKAISSQRSPQTEQGMARTGTELLFLYNQAGVIVNQLGYDNWSEEIIHSDWHPGNMLFSNHKVVAVLDLETVRKAPAICDLGNGALQFSIVSGRPQPSDWPDYLDTERLTAFLDGYNAVTELPEEKIRSVPFLMIETMICESVLPIATTGSFGKLDGGDFLDMIFRKSKWIFDNKDSLTKTLLS